MLLSVCEFRIYLIRNNKDVFLDDNIDKLGKLFLRHDRTRRVVGEGKDEDLGLVGDGVKKLLLCELKLILFLKLHDHGLTACHDHTGLIGNVAGLGKDNLVTFLEHYTERHVDGFASADRDECLRKRIVFKIESSL